MLEYPIKEDHMPVFDYKKEYKDLYGPATTPVLIEVPKMKFVGVEGQGDPNEPDGDYAKAVELLYGIQYTIKMSKKGDRVPQGYFDYVVPPLEGLWWFNDGAKKPPKDKSNYNWISLIRLPEFVDQKTLQWACEEVAKKKKLDAGKAGFMEFREGLCTQCMHLGSFDDEPKTLKVIDSFIADHNLVNDINDVRKHHEIYLSDPRKTTPEKMKTVLRIPVKRK
jgi:hypothetical protein